MKVKVNKFIKHLAQCLEHRNLCFGEEVKKGILLCIGRAPVLKKILTSHCAYNSNIFIIPALYINLY